MSSNTRTRALAYLATEVDTKNTGVAVEAHQLNVSRVAQVHVALQLRQFWWRWLPGWRQKAHHSFHRGPVRSLAPLVQYSTSLSFLLRSLRVVHV